MKPKTKLELEVVKLSKQLPKISQPQKIWAFYNCLDQAVHFKKKEAVCFVCGNTWLTAEHPELITEDGAFCPCCATKLTKRDTLHKFKDCAYTGIFTTYKGYQIYRILWVQQKCQNGKPADRWTAEVVQHWISPNGKNVILAKSVYAFSGSMYYDQWAFGSSLEVRNYHLRHNVNPWKVYPRQNFIPELKRNGFTGNFFDIPPFDFITEILRDRYAEAMLKSGQIQFLKDYCNRKVSNVHWPSLKICIRNNYIISDPGMWADHIRLLDYFGKDVHNAFYVCPADLKKEHQILIERKRKIDNKEAKTERLKKQAIQDIEYKKAKAKFIGLKFTDSEINISVLKSVNAFFKEGKHLHHCVSSYHTKEDSLVLSARKGKERLETVEISLSKMEIIQCRGLCNEITPYHDQIIDLVRKSLPVIEKLCV